MPGHGHPHHARGGAADDDSEGESKEKRDAHTQVYNAQGSAAMKSATDEEPGFTKGGKVRRPRRRHGGNASGHMAPHRLDERPRRAAGGRTAGHNPYSSASEMRTPADDVAGRGYEGLSTDARGTK